MNGGYYPSYPVPSPGQATGHLYHGYPGAGAGSPASAIAAATSNTLKLHYGLGYPSVPGSGPAYLQGSQTGFGPALGGYASDQAQDETLGNGFLPGYYPGPELYTNGFKSAAEAEFQAEANGNQYGLSGSSAEADADASANQYGLPKSSFQTLAGAAALTYGVGGSAQTQSQVGANADLYGLRKSAEAAVSQSGNGSPHLSAHPQGQFATNANQHDQRDSLYTAGAPAQAIQVGSLSTPAQSLAEAAANGQAAGLAAGQAQSELGLNQFGSPADQFEARGSNLAAQNQVDATAALGQSGSVTAAQGQTEANAKQSGFSAGHPGFSVASAASANAATGSQFRPFGDDLNNGYEAVPVLKAEAAAEANGRFSGKQNSNYLLQSVQASTLYPKLYPRPSSHVTPLYLPPGLKDGNAESPAFGQSNHALSAGKRFAFTLACVFSFNTLNNACSIGGLKLL